MKNRARSPDLKILASHPVQYHVPFIREMVARGLDVEVTYYHQGTAGRMGHDAEFGLDFEWDLDLLGGYRHNILQSSSATYTWSEQTRVAQRLVPWVLRDQSPVLLMGWFSEITWLVWLLGVIQHVPMLVLSETTPLSFRASYKPRWRVSFLSWLLRRSAACLYIGTRNRTFLSGMGVDKERLFYCPYSVDNSFFYEQTARLLPQREGYCLEYGLVPSLPAFLFCGKLVPKKRPLNLLNAYLDAGLGDRAQLIFVGDGSERHALARRIGECGARHVHLLGFFNYRAMPLAYVLGEVLCLPSGPTETWGLVVNESLACRRPALVSAAAGCAPDLVGPGSGWTVPVDNHAALVQALRTAFESRAEWPVMGCAGRAKAAGHTFSKMADGVESALAFIHK